jgi:hypothetical protein
MRKTQNINLNLYDQSDIFNITGSQNSLNSNFEIIDEEINAINNTNSIDEVKNDVASLKEDIENLEEDNILGFVNNRVRLNNFVDKEIGGIDTSTGQNVPVSSSGDRIRTNLLNIKNAVVNPIDGYVVLTFYYNTDGSFSHYDGAI